MPLVAQSGRVFHEFADVRIGPRQEFFNVGREFLMLLVYGFIMQMHATNSKFTPVLSGVNYTTGFRRSPE